jgi:hypothetical protein
MASKDERNANCLWKLVLPLFFTIPIEISITVLASVADANPTYVGLQAGYAVF